jgi:hypothetical protein
MQPDEEVQITMTRSEASRIHAALSALCEVQRMVSGTGMASAIQLTDSVEVIEQVLPRLRECFPEQEGPVEHIERYQGEAKTYADTFDVKVKDLMGMTPKESAVVFATEYDEAIKAVLHSLEHFTDFTHEEFHELLNYTKDLLRATMPVPANLSVKDAQPYVKTSDLITLGALAYEMYVRQDQIKEDV